MTFLGAPEVVLTWRFEVYASIEHDSVGRAASREEPLLRPTVAALAAKLRRNEQTNGAIQARRLPLYLETERLTYRRAWRYSRKVLLIGVVNPRRFRAPKRLHSMAHYEARQRPRRMLSGR